MKTLKTIPVKTIFLVKFFSEDKNELFYITETVKDYVDLYPDKILYWKDIHGKSKLDKHVYYFRIVRTDIVKIESPNKNL